MKTKNIYAMAGVCWVAAAIVAIPHKATVGLTPYDTWLQQRMTTAVPNGSVGVPDPKSFMTYPGWPDGWTRPARDFRCRANFYRSYLDVDTNCLRGI